MNTSDNRALLVVLAIASLAASGTASAQDRDRDRVRDPATTQDQAQQSTQDRDRDRTADRDRILDRDRVTDQDRDRDRDQDRDRDGDQDRERLHVQDRDQLRDRDIYGYALMSAEERNQYRSRMRELETEQEWARFRAAHQTSMTARARERGAALDPPLYGQQLMTDRECVELRERLGKALTEQDRERIRAEHRTRMNERARELGVPVAEIG